MPGGRPRIDEELRKNSVIEAGRASFVELGYESTTSNLIAERSRVSKRTFYELFEGKGELLVELLDAPRTPLLRVPSEPMSTPALASEIAKLFFIDEAGFSERPDHYFLVRAAWEGRDRVAILDAAFDKTRNQIADWIGSETTAFGQDGASVAAMILNVGFGRSPAGHKTPEAREKCAVFLRECFNVLSKSFG